MLPSVTDPRPWKPNASTWRPGQLVDGLLEREVAPLADVPGEQERRVARRAQHLHVRARIRGADEHRGIRERATDAVDVGVGDADGDDAGTAVVGEHEVGEDVRRVATLRVDELGERAPQPRFVLGADHLDDAHTLQPAVREQRGAGAIPLGARGRPPLGIPEERGLVGRARGDHLVPALGHAHEHHRRVPAEPEVDRSRRQLRVGARAVVREPGRQVEPTPRRVRVAVDVDEARPGQRDAASTAAAREVLERGHGVLAEELGDDLDEPAAGALDDVEQRVELGTVGRPRGHRPSVRVAVEERRRESPCAGLHRGVEQRGHRRRVRRASRHASRHRRP